MLMTFILQMRVRKLESKTGSLVNQQDLSFLSDKTMGLGKVLKLRHHPKGCLEIRGEAFVIITTEGCF